MMDLFLREAADRIGGDDVFSRINALAGVFADPGA
jgi:hypothetical protein